MTLKTLKKWLKYSYFMTYFLLISLLQVWQVGLKRLHVAPGRSLPMSGLACAIKMPPDVPPTDKPEKKRGYRNAGASHCTTSRSLSFHINPVTFPLHPSSCEAPRCSPWGFAAQWPRIMKLRFWSYPLHSRRWHHSLIQWGVGFTAVLWCTCKFPELARDKSAGRFLGWKKKKRLMTAIQQTVTLG